MMKLDLFSTRRCFSNTSRCVPIAIVGGGPAGLFLSNLLSTYKLGSILLEARSTDQVFSHPQAHFLNTRSMEIMRHTLPNLYNRVCQHMPPVDEWRYFSYGYSAAGEMARVVHPVDIPLRAKTDANGILLPAGQVYDNNPTKSSAFLDERQNKDSNASAQMMSVCSVGHLAQHTFSKLLYESALELLYSESEVRFESPVEDITWEDGAYRLTTKSGAIIFADVVVGADGSNSKVRQGWNIEWGKGREGIQHLINVHIRTTLSVEPSAMLYAVYNEKCIAMMVRHSATEYVLQLPYFPPYQSVERHFTTDQVASILFKILKTNEFEIISIRPWVMSSLIASKYTDGNSGVILGDAAHVFPPAGGFGMNTGLQDAFSIAWRLASSFNHGSNLRRHLLEYDAERQEIARDNAALSVRNFERVLKLAKCCYLNEEYPVLLTQALDKMPLPLDLKQDIFSGLLHTALAPLKSLKDGSSVFAKHVTSRLRSILEQGGGLPLLFPKFEIGYGYKSKTDLDKVKWEEDSMGGECKVQVGHLVPHVPLTVISGESQYPNLQWISRGVITASDLPSQLRRSHPVFVLFVVEWEGDQLMLDKLVEMVRKSFGLQTAIAHVVKDASLHVDNFALCDFTGDFHAMVTGLVLIRPDGHVCYIGDGSNLVEMPWHDEIS